MADGMSVSMTIRVIDEASSEVKSLTGAMRELKAVEEGVGAVPTRRGAEWDAERSAIQRVGTEMRALGTVHQDTGAITAATSAWRQEASAVESVAEAASRTAERLIDMVRRRREEERAAFQTRQAEDAEGFKRAVARPVDASVGEGATRQGDGTVGEDVARFGQLGPAIEGVTVKLAAMRDAAAEAGAPIGEAVGKLRDEAAALDGVIGRMHELAEVARTAVPPIPPPGGPSFTDVRRAGPPEGEKAGQGSYDWGGARAPEHAGPVQGLRASDWVAQQQALQEVEETAGRATDRVTELEHSMARLGMAGMAFGQMRQFGEDVRRPIEAADDAWTEFQAKTQDLATRSENNGRQSDIGEHILKVARDANVPWQQVYEGEQALASLGGGKQLQAMQAFETRMNKLALAGHVEAEDIYSGMMHYIKGGLSAADAMDVLEQQHVQGQRGSVELNQLAQYMPSLMALGKEFGMTPKQAAIDTSALLQIMRENTGTAGQADTLLRQAMTKLGDPRTVKRLETDLDIDGFQVRADAKARGENPLVSLFNAIADKFEKLTPEQKGTAVATDGEGHGVIQGGDPKIMGDLARDYYFRSALDAFIQHRKELPQFDVDPEEARRNTDASYAAQNNTVRQAKQTAENSKAEAAIRAGITQTAVMKAKAGVEAGAWDAGGAAAQRFPIFTSALGLGTDAFGSTLMALGHLGEAAIGAATAWKSAQYIGAKIPALGEVGGAVRSAFITPFDAFKGFAEGFAGGIREAVAEPAVPTTTGAIEAANPLRTAPQLPATDRIAEAAGAALKFGEASTSLGTIGLMVAAASRRDIGLGRDPSPASLAQNPLNIVLPGDPGTPPHSAVAGIASAVQPLTDALREQARRSAEDFRREPEAARGWAMANAGTEAAAGPALPPSAVQPTVAAVEGGTQAAIARASAAMVPPAPAGPALPLSAVQAIVTPVEAGIQAAVARASAAMVLPAPAGPVLPLSAVQAIVAPVEAGIQAAIARASAAMVLPAPRPTAAEAPQQVTNNNQKTVNAPITVNAPVTINATMTNTTPGAVGAAVGAGIRGGVRAGAGALHDGPETK